MIKATICQYRMEHGKSASEVRELSGMSQGDYYKKLKHPEQFRIIDLKRIGKAAGVPQEKMVQEVAQLLINTK